MPWLFLVLDLEQDSYNLHSSLVGNTILKVSTLLFPYIMHDDGQNTLPDADALPNSVDSFLRHPVGV